MKGDQENEKEEEEVESMKASDKKIEEKPQDDRFISTINGNIVHVTVNNFITTDKPLPPPEGSNKLYNTRPFSSDAKERERKSQNQPGKYFPSDVNMSSTFKNPYETKMIGKIGSNLRGAKKRE